MPSRSWLYVPGDARDKVEGSLRRGADAVILDLEDSVAPSAKEAARALVVEWLTTNAARLRDDVAPRAWVRINAAADWRDDDLAALVPAVRSGCLAGVVVPKASVALLATVRDALAAADDQPATRLAGLVEDAHALTDLARLARSPGLSHLGVGEADLCAELRLDPSEDEAELRPLRLSVVVASAAAGIPPPVAATSTDFRDLDALRRSTDRLRRLGFGGRTAIHPRQVPVINEVFTPTEQQVAEARDVVDRFDTAVAEGSGVATDADGRMLDEAVVRRARQTLALADAAGEDVTG